MTAEEKRKCEVSVKYLERLMSGRNPVNNSILENDTVFTDDNVRRCFAFIVDVLNRVCSEDSFQRKTSRDDRFPLTYKPNAKSVIRETVQPREVTARELETIISSNLSEIVEEAIEKIPINRISNYLLDEGYLSSIADSEGKKHREATDAGEAIGITNNLVQFDGREPFVQYRFTPKGQLFVFEHLSEINSHIHANKNSTMADNAE